MVVIPILDTIKTHANRNGFDNSLNALLDNLRTPFDYMDSEYKIIKALSHSGLVDNVTICNLHTEFESSHTNYELQFSKKQAKSVILPIKFQIKKFKKKTTTL